MAASKDRRARGRRRLPSPVGVEVGLCSGDACTGSIQNEEAQGLGVALRGAEATRAWQHRECCLGATVSLRVSSQDGALLHLPVRFVHLSADPFDSTNCTFGVALEVHRLGTRGVQKVLEVWNRLQRASA